MGYLQDMLHMLEERGVGFFATETMNGTHSFVLDQ